MRLFRSTMIAALALLTAGAAPTGGGDQRVLDIDAPYVTMKMNGELFKLRVDFDAPVGTIMLNPAAAKRAHAFVQMGVKASKCLPEDIDLSLALGNGGILVDIDGKTLKRVIGWRDRNVIDDADGIINPDLLPENRVTLRLHAPEAGEQTIEIPVKPMLYEYTPHRFLSNHVVVGKKVVALSYAPQQPYNIATAAAGAHLAATRDGHWSGEPLRLKQKWGVDRPGRPMAFDRGLSLGGLPLRSLVVDTGFLKGDAELPPDDPAPEPAPDPERASSAGEKPDPDAITVTGNKIKPRAATRSRFCASIELVLGQESLGVCSSISYDRKGEKLILRCL